MMLNKNRMRRKHVYNAIKLVIQDNEQILYARVQNAYRNQALIEICKLKIYVKRRKVTRLKL